MPNLRDGSLIIRRADTELDVPLLVDLNRYVQDVHAAGEPSSFLPGHGMPDATGFHSKFMDTDGCFTFGTLTPSPGSETDCMCINCACVVLQQKPKVVRPCLKLQGVF